jgi:hypothetical protein
LKDLTRELYVYIDSNESYNYHSYEIADIELILSPVGPLIDGSPGQVITLLGSAIDRGGYGLENVPVGKYKATTSYCVADMKLNTLNKV